MRFMFKDRAIETGLDSDCASYLLSIVGISNTISRVALGYISDKPWVNRLYLYNVALSLCGLGTCVSIFFTTFVGQAFYAAVFGATSGAYVGLTSVVLVDLLGMEKLTNAFGVLLMFQGIASLIGPPLCGALYDMSGSYDYSFLLAGFMIFISGIMLFLLPCAKRVQARQETKKIVRQYSRA
ncbi:Monocarboxylate transporter 5 [Armadillidium vulgare]|nr:Monocarboxylate transporter 5 [Armadillidium vulgare]